MQLYCERFGAGEPVLLLLHGLAGNGAVWRPLLNVIRDRWPGEIVVPDLRGHGRSPHGEHYAFGHHAADLADLFPPGKRVTAVGHSMGAAVALTAANGWHGISIDTVLGFGVKTGFTETEIEKAHSLAQSPVRWFDTRAEAADRFLRLSGLKGLIGDDAEVVDAGVHEENGRWRVAADPRTFTPPSTALEDLFRVKKTRLRLACGSEDQMVTIDQARRFDPGAVELSGLGHNLHVQAPQTLADLMERVL